MSGRARFLLPCLAVLLPTACTRVPGATTAPGASLTDTGSIAPETSEPPPSTLPGPCASARDSTPFSIQTTEPGDRARLHIQPDPGLGSARLYKRVDLNGDGREELLLSFPSACGNHGECPVGIYLDCGEGIYARIWGPEYAIDLEVQPGSGSWHELKWSQSGDEHEPIIKELRFEQGAYQEFQHPR